MYNKIIVPLDGSKLAEAVVPFVNEIILGAKESRKIEITLLQVVPCTREIVGDDGIGRVPCSTTELEKMKKPVMAYLSKIAGAFKKEPMVTINTLVKVGDDPAEEILKACEELKADLITISTHGRSGVGRWAYGSVADKILRGGNTPVFMVRASKKAK